MIEIGGGSRDVKSNQNATTPNESTQIQLVPSDLKEIKDEKPEIKLNSQSRLVISTDDMRASALQNLKPD